ncbi:MAG: PQQ-dependent sugar dehydrogenase [Rhodobacteraceae bacterium]|nr:PQQ-dependent sugar dehydrogenase [Paracoccaceae bacterium]
MRHITLVLAALTLAAGLAPATAQTMRTSQGDLSVSPVLTGLEQPWAVGFLPDGGILVTLREGRLLLLPPDATEARDVADVPRVFAQGQGGLLDVVVARDFAQSREIFLSYAKPMQAGAGTALAVARLSEDGTRLESVRDIWVQPRPTGGGRHFGSRIVEALDGTLFVTIGDRGQDEEAQNLSNAKGTVVRVNRDGSVPADNPRWEASDALPEIYSFGHRNAQGAALDLEGNLWVSEHGARGGDEVNRVRAGANYGWPVIAYGRHYSGRQIGVGTEKEGMEQPDYYWDPSMAPSGTMIYSGRLWPEWAGHIFVGALQHDYIARLGPQGGRLAELEQLQSKETARVRDVREAPDGTIWFLSVNEGTLFRIAPEGG